MKYAFSILLVPIFLWAQDFEFRQEYGAIPVEIYGWAPFSPFSGGEEESSPAFCDIDDDGDFDAFVGNMGGWITHYENIGTAAIPNFSFVTKHFAGVEQFGGRTTPEFCDIDADGDFDLFSGDWWGRIRYWENIGTPETSEFVLVSDSLENIHLPGLAQIAFADMDADGDYDILSGSYLGTLAYYENVGTPDSLSFPSGIEPFENIDVGERSSPCLVDIDADTDFDLFIGDDDGRIWYYRNDGDSANYSFTFITDFLDSINVGWYATPALADLDSDGDFELFIGRDTDWNTETPGDIFSYRNDGTPQSAQFNYITSNYLSIDEGPLAHVDLIDIDADEDQDLFASADHVLRFYRNTGTFMAPAFTKESDAFQNIVVDDLSPFFCDIDADSDYDVFFGTATIPGPPGLYLFINQGTPQEPDFRLVSENFVPGNYNVAIYPTLGDIDADGDLDLLLCDHDTLYFFENQGTPQLPNFQRQPGSWQGIYPGITQRWSRFWDIDDDGDLDFFFNNYYNLTFYRNLGTPQSANMVLEDTLFITGLDYSQTGAVFGFDFVDVDADSDGDFFGSTGAGGAFFFRNITGEASAPPPVERHPRAGLQISLGPNPANPITVISFNLPFAQPIDLAVYNLLGARVTTLASGPKLPGSYVIPWVASGNASGVYIIWLETPQQSLAEKLTIIK